MGSQRGYCDVNDESHFRFMTVMNQKLICKFGSLDLTIPHVMGVLNVTPDSFSDGGRFVQIDSAIEHALSMIDQGASILDIGGESTRPGASAVSDQEEIDRVIPIIEALLKNGVTAPISIDTSKPQVMQKAIAAGASMINDVRALREQGAMAMAVQLNVPVCLMHMQGQPRTMQKNPCYTDVVEDVYQFLNERIVACVTMGIQRSNLLVDPGFGFGKTLEHNLSLLRNLSRFSSLQLPIVVGLSRKSMFGMLLKREVDARLPASIAGATLATWFGASIIRAHDVAATMDAVRLCAALKEVTQGQRNLP